MFKDRFTTKKLSKDKNVVRDYLEKAEFKCTNEALDFILNSGAYSDSYLRLVSIFGKMKEGQITELTMIDIGTSGVTSSVNFVKDFGEKSKLSKDLWF